MILQITSFDKKKKKKKKSLYQKSIATLESSSFQQLSSAYTLRFKAALGLPL